MPFACWITKATNTHLEYVIFIAFPWQQWLRERASMLRYSTLPVLLQIYVIGDDITYCRGSPHTAGHSERS
jgi:hypothetical protein